MEGQYHITQFEVLQQQKKLYIWRILFHKTAGGHYHNKQLEDTTPLHSIMTLLYNTVGKYYPITQLEDSRAQNLEDTTPLHFWRILPTYIIVG